MSMSRRRLGYDVYGRAGGETESKDAGCSKERKEIGCMPLKGCGRTFCVFVQHVVVDDDHAMILPSKQISNPSMSLDSLVYNPIIGSLRCRMGSCCSKPLSAKVHFMQKQPLNTFYPSCAQHELCNSGQPHQAGAILYNCDLHGSS